MFGWEGPPCHYKWVYKVYIENFWDFNEILIETCFHKNRTKKKTEEMLVNNDINENQDPEILTIRTSHAKVEVDVE